MGSVRWKEEDDEDNLPLFVDVNDTLMTTSTTAAVTSSILDSADEENFAVDIGPGESDCFGCNVSTLKTLNVSTPPFPSRVDDYDQHQSHDELYEVPLSMIIILSLLYGGISVSALVGNTLVLWVVGVSRRMRTVTNMFIANLAMADIIIGLFTIPFQFQAALLQRWNLPDFMCAFCPFVQVLSVNVSVFTLSAIAVDRYRAVLYPLSARVSKRKATWAILSIWAVGFLLALPTELDYKVTYIEDKGGTKPFCANLGLPASFRMFYHQGIVVIQYFFPLIIITGAYVHMGTKLWGATAPGNKEESRDAVVLRNKKKVIKMLALVVLMFALCWLPLQTYNFFQTIFPAINEYQYINVLWFGFHSLAMSNSCCNPFIYAIYNDKFQREFQSRLRCLRRCSKTRDDITFSEASDFDRSKIRASYRFTNNRLGASSVTNRSFYNPSSRSNSLYKNNHVQQNNRNNSECQGNTRYLGVGTYTFRTNYSQNQQQQQTHSLPLSQSSHNHHHHRHHNRGHRQCYNGSGGGSDASENNSSSSSSGTFPNEIAAELAECNTRYLNGDLRVGTNNYNGSSSNIETETHHQETSLTVVMNAPTATAPVVVVTSNGKVATNGSNNQGKAVTVMAKDAAIKL